MKKTLLSAVVLASLGMASTVMAATETFQWVGSVPLYEADSSITIVPVNSTDFNGGTLIFDNKKGVISLTGSTELSFKVVEGAGAAADAATVAYDMQMTSIKLGAVELEADGEFELLNSGVAMGRFATATPVAANASPTVLTIGAKNTDLQSVNEGDTAVVQAVLVITPQGA